jgi:hypothetical protein
MPVLDQITLDQFLTLPEPELRTRLERLERERATLYVALRQARTQARREARQVQVKSLPTGGARRER